MQQQFEGAEEARKAVDANTSPRYKRLEFLERWVTGRQYDGLKSWWDDDVPLWERAPCIVYPVAQIAIQSNTDLVLGEGRFPSFSAKPGEDDGEDESGTDQKAADALDRYIDEYHRICRFKAHSREAFSAAQGCGTAVAVHGARDGKPFADLIPAKWGTPTFGNDGRTVLSLEIKYPYVEEYQKPDGKWAVRPKLYRRIIDEANDTTFLPADANINGIEPAWVRDPNLSGPHGLGFCPVVWYPFMRGCQPVNVIDGQAIHANVTDEIRQLDIAISQRHRGALLSEPQVCEIGVQSGYNPTELGRTPGLVSTEKGGTPGPDNKITGQFGGGPTKPARKKGPGYVWQYTDPLTKVQYLVYPGEALKAQDDNARDLRTKVMHALSVVLLDHEAVAGIRQLSGKALEAIKQTQLDRCDQYRDDVRDGFLLPSIDMQLRISQRLGKRLRVSGSDKVAAALSKFNQPEPKATPLRAVGQP